MAATGADDPLVVVCAALVDAEQRVLLQRRPEGKSMAGLWEFPGGKLSPGETPEAALVRELEEELGIEVAPGAVVPLTFASHAYPDFHILLLLYVCHRWQGVPTSREGQALAWVRKDDLGDYPMPPADKPLVAMLWGIILR
ncbi:MAG TPA: 8-oxo-dGTP diphosphatase MutT [Stellaceae bacterium]|nr:8-oxo-dGTP diphosphatase MutT [Stellaceae bacterium]